MKAGADELAFEVPLDTNSMDQVSCEGCHAGDVMHTHEVITWSFFTIVIATSNCT